MKRHPKYNPKIYSETDENKSLSDSNETVILSPAPEETEDERLQSTRQKLYSRELFHPAPPKQPFPIAKRRPVYQTPKPKTSFKAQRKERVYNVNVKTENPIGVTNEILNPEYATSYIQPREEILRLEISTDPNSDQVQVVNAPIQQTIPKQAVLPQRYEISTNLNSDQVQVVNAPIQQTVPQALPQSRRYENINSDRFEIISDSNQQQEISITQSPTIALENINVPPQFESAREVSAQITPVVQANQPFTQIQIPATQITPSLTLNVYPNGSAAQPETKDGPASIPIHSFDTQTSTTTLNLPQVEETIQTERPPISKEPSKRLDSVNVITQTPQNVIRSQPMHSKQNSQKLISRQVSKVPIHETEKKRTNEEILARLSQISHDIQVAKQEKTALVYENAELKTQLIELKKYSSKPTTGFTVKSVHFPPGTSKIPTSVQANLNLQYQHKQRIELERARYESLQQENKNLAGRIKTLEFQRKFCINSSSEKKYVY